MIDFTILREFLHMLELVDNIEPIGKTLSYRKGIEVLKDQKYCGDVFTEALAYGFFKDRTKPTIIEFKSWLINESKVIQSFLKNR